MHHVIIGAFAADGPKGGARVTHLTHTDPIRVSTRTTASFSCGNTFLENDFEVPEFVYGSPGRKPESDSGSRLFITGAFITGTRV